MESLLFLASTEVGEKGFGFNFNILETNLINLSIILVLVFNFGKSFLGKVLSERKAKIETAIQEAETRQKEAAAALADQQQKLAQAQVEAEKIRKEADRNAENVKQAILAKAASDVENMKANAVKDVESERDRAIAELRQRVAVLAMQKVETQLRTQLDNTAQAKLIDRSISLLGGA